MKRILYIIFILSLNSCYTDYKEIWVKNPDEVEIVLNLNVPEAKQTRAQLSHEDETNIANIKVFVFDASNKFKYEAPISSAVTAGAASSPYQAKGSLKVRLIKSTAEEQYKIVVIANIAAADDVPTLTAGSSTYDDLKNGLKFNNVQDYSTRKLPMWGEITKKITNAKVDIDMLRAIARVDVGLKFKTYPSEDVEGLSNFNLTDVNVYNVNNIGYYIPAAANISSMIAITPTIPTTATRSGNNYENTVSDNKGLIRNIYISENVNKSVAKAEKTYVIIGGQYGGSTTKSYYRLDFINGSDALDILRNHRYRFDIQKIGAPGAATIDDAKTAENINIVDAELTVWDENNLSPRGSSKLVKYRHDYMLGIDKDEVSLFVDKGSEGVVMARTNWTSGWTAEVVEGAEWLEITNGTGAQNADAELKFRTTSENTTGSDRSGKIRITANNISWDITVIQSLTPEVRLEVLDGDTREPISFYEAPSTGTPTASPKKIIVRWLPSDAELGQSSAALNIDGTTTPNFILEADGTKTINGRYAEQKYNLEAGSLSVAFDEKNFNIDFMVGNKGVSVEKTLVAFQKNYDVIAYDDATITQSTPLVDENPNNNDTKRYFMDGKEVSIKIFANTPYKLELVESKSVMPNAPTDANAVDAYTTSTHVGQDGKFGFPNFTTSGEIVKIRTVNDVKKTGQTLLGYARFKVTSIENKFEPKYFKVIFRSGRVQNDANSFLVNANQYPGYETVLSKDIIPILIPLKRIVDAGITTPSDLNTNLVNLRPKIYWTEYDGTNESVDKEGLKVVGSTTDYNNAYLLVPLKDGFGNSVVGVKKTNVEGALWSWHIWKLSGTTDPDVKVKGGFMDRNLGAIYAGTNEGGSGESKGAWVTGLYYQWGRKDPFVSKHFDKAYFNNDYANDANNLEEVSTGIDNTAYPKNSSGQVSVADAVKNPHIFYIDGNHWMTPLNTDLWKDGKKTIYDPCPYGWKVPTKTDLEKISNEAANNVAFSGGSIGGHKSSTYGFWPRSGDIKADGAYEEYANYGRYFSTTILGPTNSNLPTLDISSVLGGITTNIVELYSISRGFSIRCVRNPDEDNSATVDDTVGEDY